MLCVEHETASGHPQEGAPTIHGPGGLIRALVGATLAGRATLPLHGEVVCERGPGARPLTGFQGCPLIFPLLPQPQAAQ